MILVHSERGVGVGDELWVYILFTVLFIFIFIKRNGKGEPALSLFSLLIYN